MSAPTVPDGYWAFGWHRFVGDLWRGSVAHLVPEEQTHLARGGTIRLAFGAALCGRGRTGRTTHADTVETVAADLRRGERKPCARCFRLAAERPITRA